MNNMTPSIKKSLSRLGIDPLVCQKRNLPCFDDVSELYSLGRDVFNREQFATQETVNAWNKMHSAAQQDHIVLQLVSAFRSITYQEELIRRKLDRKIDLKTILNVNAPPGYSEHHSGRALDITTPEFTALESHFDKSPAFQWLFHNASTYGFTMTYPKKNKFGFAYEPWHWCFDDTL